MGFKSRIKLSRPLSGFIKSTDQSHKFIEEAGSLNHYQHPLLMRSIMQKKRNSKKQSKPTQKSKEPIKNDLIDANDESDITNEEEENFNKINNKNYEEQDEFSELYGDAPMVRKIILYIGSKKEKHLT